jgi:hypothetical protein
MSIHCNCNDNFFICTTFKDIPKRKKKKTNKQTKKQKNKAQPLTKKQFGVEVLVKRQSAIFYIVPQGID